MQRRLSTITGIPVRVLQERNPAQYSIAQRMSWAASRRTTRPEDIAYSLLGLFDVNMPMLYGEGSKAFIRLQEEIIKYSDDHSIFAWSSKDDKYRGLLAPSPACFSDSGNFVPVQSLDHAKQYSMTNIGLSIQLRLSPWAMDTYLAVLDCRDRTAGRELMPHAREDVEDERVGIYLKRMDQAGQYVRVQVAGKDLLTNIKPKFMGSFQSRVILVRQKIRVSMGPDLMYGFIFHNVGSGVFPAGHSDRPSFNIITARETPKGSLSSGPSFSDVLHGRYFKRDYLQYVEKIELPVGSAGMVATFIRDPKPNSHLPELLSVSANIALIAFGFDFDFNPRCMIDTTESQIWKEYVLDPSKHLNWNACIDDVFDHCSVLGKDRSLSVHQVCAFNGDRGTGLRVRSSALNLNICIPSGWKDTIQRAWVVQISTLLLPRAQSWEGSLGTEDIPLRS